jgi:hypothetical protein
MVRAGVLRGRILDRKGKPARNQDVHAVPAAYYEGRPVLRSLPIRTGTTDSRGEYRFEGLSPGPYFVGAHQRDFHPSFAVDNCGPFRNGLPAGVAAGLASSPSSVYYPGTSDPASALELHISPGQETAADFSLSEPPKGFRIRGQILHVDGTRPSKAQVTLLPAGRILHGTTAGRNQFCTIEAGSGKFDFTTIPPGSYELVVEAVEKGQSQGARVRIDVRENLSDLRVALQPLRKTGGSIRPVRPLTAGEIAAITVRLFPDTPPALSVSPPSLLEQLAAAQPAGDGSFLLPEVPPGRYQVAVTNLPAGLSIESIRSGGRDVLREGMMLPASPTESLEIELSAFTTAVSGSVRTGARPLAAMTVVLVPDTERSRWDLYKVAISESSGDFQFDGIRPGDYRIFAWATVPEGAWRNAEFMRWFEDEGTPVRAEAGSKQAVELQVRF